PSPNRGSLDNALKGLAAVGPDDIWSVGEYNPGIPPTATGRRSLAEHWDGSRWRLVKSQDPSWDGRDYSTLEDVDAIASNDIWAVGDATTCHYDGVSWELVPSPQPRPEYYEIAYPLEAVSAVSSDDIWAVGARVTDFWSIDFFSFAEHWDGTRWTAVYNVDGS